MAKEVILTGIRANNDLTIGNYFGAIMPAIDMARNRSEQFQVNLFVPDLHSFTTPTDLSSLQSAIWNNLRIFAAAGLPLDNPDIHIYRQSYIPAHSELTWILSCFTGIGEMGRMTQFKDKSEKVNKLESYISELQDKVQQMVAKVPGGQDKDAPVNLEEYLQADPGLTHEVFMQLLRMFGQKPKDTGLVTNNVTVGLFSYPVLMAADILLYGATYVPVGEDQTQHLEFTRDIAERMNARFGELFTIPKPVKEQNTFFGKDQGLRIKDLQDPTKKMSKSDDSGKGVIFLSDSPEETAKKITSATTDSLGKIDPDNQDQPGIANLLQILSLVTGRSIEDVKSQYVGQEQYGPLKSEVAAAVSQFLADLQSKLVQVDDQTIATKLEQSEAAMRETADQTLQKVQKVVGLR